MSSAMQNQWLELKEKAVQIWESTLAPRYNALEESEQRILRIAAIALPLILFVFGLLLPVADNNKALRVGLASIASQAAQADHLADILAANPAGNNADTQGTPLTRVDKIARQTDIHSFMTKLRPQPGIGNDVGLQIQLKEAPYPKVTTFISTLERSGLAVTQLRMYEASNGHVHLQAVIK